MPDDALEVPDAAPVPSEKRSGENTQGLIMKNTLFMLVAQVLGTPLSMVVNAVMARHLGPEEFGYIYLAGTLASFGFIVIDWGQAGTLPAMVALDRGRAGELVGSGLLWRGFAIVFVYPMVAGICFLLGYNTELQIALALVFASSAILSATAAGSDTVLGFERTDIRALALVGQQFIMALVVIPTLLFGGRLRATLTAQIAGALLTGIFVWRMVVGTGIRKLSYRRETVRALLTGGIPILAMSLVMTLQPSVDAVLLAKLGTAEAVGWHAAARKLVGVLVFPAVALTNALYPTLCRLYAENKEAYRKSVGSALQTATVVVVPVALGCFLYADVGIRIFNKETFGPAEDNLKVLSVFILILYFSMALGISLIAGGKQREWAAAQFGCVAVSSIIDPILIPWFQRRNGNGGLGVCVATVLSECLMIGVGIWLSMDGVFNAKVIKGIGLSFLAGGAMVGVALALRWVSPFVAAPIAVLAYVGGLYVVGGLDEEQIQTIRAAVARKARRSG
jgi:O-antigen/teichoic acid export membrane protein